MDLKVIETNYKGYLFRSRLEARWAVFFDALNIKWEYEKEGFDLGNGVWYLPDFWLPTFSGSMWAEVKYEGGDFSKPGIFARDFNQQIWICEGYPTSAIYKIFDGSKNAGRFIDCGIPNFDQAQDQDRMYGVPCEYGDICADNCKDIHPIPLPEKYILFSPFHDAINKAKSARF